MFAARLAIAALLVAQSHSINKDPYEGLVWFLQISDVHISSVQDQSRVTEFAEFTGKYLDVYKPSLVLCTGDLTEAKVSGGLSSRQVEEEWRTYYNIVRNRSRDVPWLDLRGNHDNLNVLSRASNQNLFRNYSEMGRKGNLESYVYTTSLWGQRYNFVGLDATLDTGMRYPFNFVGDFSETQQKVIRNLTRQIQQDDINIFFGHYPSSVVRQSKFLLDTVAAGLVYVCGHLHDLALFRMRTMYSLHGGNNLELELRDWKNNRAYRLLAVDQGFLSFTDVTFNQWPVILPTFPKNSEFSTRKEPDIEPGEAGFIRVLVFSDQPILSVYVSVDDEKPRWCHRVGEGPLYVVSWNPQNYRTGLHRLRVNATDAERRNQLYEHPFTLDKSAAEPFSHFLSNLVLNSSFPLIFQALFTFSLLLSSLPLTLVYYTTLAYTSRRLPTVLAAVVKFLLSTCIVKRILFVSSVRMLFWFYSVYPVYMACGPWVIGRIVEDEYGGIFAWGAVVDNKYVPVSVTFGQYFFDFLVIHPSVVLISGHILYSRSNSGVAKGKLCHFGIFSLFCCILAIFLFLALTFWIQFGALGFFASPLRTWGLALYGLSIVCSFRAKIPNIATGLYLDDRGKKEDDEERTSQSSANETTRMQV